MARFSVTIPDFTRSKATHKEPVCAMILPTHTDPSDPCLRVLTRAGLGVSVAAIDDDGNERHQPEKAYRYTTRLNVPDHTPPPERSLQQSDRWATGHREKTNYRLRGTRTSV
jgi:hypothetical protein